MTCMQNSVVHLQLHRLKTNSVNHRSTSYGSTSPLYKFIRHIKNRTEENTCDYHLLLQLITKTRTLTSETIRGNMGTFWETTPLQNIEPSENTEPNANTETNVNIINAEEKWMALFIQYPEK
jgi:hypothetical protein